MPYLPPITGLPSYFFQPAVLSTGGAAEAATGVSIPRACVVRPTAKVPQPMHVSMINELLKTSMEF